MLKIEHIDEDRTLKPHITTTQRVRTSINNYFVLKSINIKTN